MHRKTAVHLRVVFIKENFFTAATYKLAVCAQSRMKITIICSPIMRDADWWREIEWKRWWEGSEEVWVLEAECWKGSEKDGDWDSIVIEWGNDENAWQSEKKKMSGAACVSRKTGFLSSPIVTSFWSVKKYVFFIQNYWIILKIENHPP